MTTDQAREHAQTLWDYHNISQALPPAADLLLVAGSHDDRVAQRGIDIYHSTTIAQVVTSGGFGKITKKTASEPEAQRFQRIMEKGGVPSSAIIVEDAASNTGQNIEFTRALLAPHSVKTAVFVTKPYMKRRALATAAKQWPEVTWYVTAPELSFKDYPSPEVPEQRMIELMVGDFQRIRVFAELGFQIPQDIPEESTHAYQQLVKLGYNAHVITDVNQLTLPPGTVFHGTL